MNTELAKLKDIHLPQAIHMWPVAPGWLILFSLLSGLGIYFLYAWYQRHKRKRTVKFAQTKLKALEDLLANNPENINIAAEISTLIRRTALRYFQREKIAGLSGQDWLDFLNESGHTNQFTEETGQLLIDAPYRKNNTADLKPLISLTKTWLSAISKHNRPTAER